MNLNSYELIFDPELGGFYCLEEFQKIAEGANCLTYHTKDGDKLPDCFHSYAEKHKVNVKFRDGVYELIPVSTVWGGRDGTELHVHTSPGENIGTNRIGQLMFRDDNGETVIGKDNEHH